MLKLIVLGIGLSLQAFARNPPKLSPDILARYWHAIALHHAQNAALQASMTSQQKQIQESIAAIDKEIDGLRKQLAQSCGDESTLDESGPEPICMEKAKTAANPEKKK